MAELIPIDFKKIMQSRSYTVLILGTDSKQFAIYTDPHVGRTIQMHLAKERKMRPYTHDLMQSIFLGFDIKILQIVIQNIEDTIYFARIFLEQQIGEERHILEIDARPSDCMTLALMNNIPLFCRKEVFDSVIPVQE
jgi:bifunctional DNase/RNase